MFADQIKLQFEISETGNGLSISLTRRELLHLLYEAAGSVDWPAARQGGCEPSAPMLRTLLAYAYVSSIFSSADVEYSARTDETARYICAGNYPGSETIRHFRRRYFPWVRLTVARFLELASERGLGYSGSSPRRWNAPDFSVAADLLLRQAVQADSMALDE